MPPNLSPCFTCTTLAHALGQCQCHQSIGLHSTYMSPVNAVCQCQCRQSFLTCLLVQLWQTLYANASTTRALPVFCLLSAANAERQCQCCQSFSLVLLVQCTSLVNPVCQCRQSIGCGLLCVSGECSLTMPMAPKVSPVYLYSFGTTFRPEC